MAFADDYLTEILPGLPSDSGGRQYFKQSLYLGDTHRESLRELREHAIGVMREVARFNPYLTGAVLSGARRRNFRCR